MTDDRVETHVAIADPEAPSGRRVVHFQEYWVRLRAEVPAEAVVVVGLDESTPGSRRDRRDHRRRPGRCCRRPTRSSRSAPSSASRGSARRWSRPRRRWSASPPSSAARHVRGMAEQLLTAIGVEVSAAGVGLHYGARAAGRRPRRLAGRRGRRRRRSPGLRDGRAGRCRAVPLLMTDPDATAAMAAAAVELVVVTGRLDA